MKMMITLTYTMYIKQHDEYVRKKIGLLVSFVKY